MMHLVRVSGLTLLYFYPFTFIRSCAYSFIHLKRCSRRGQKIARCSNMDFLPKAAIAPYTAAVIAAKTVGLAKIAANPTDRNID